MTDYDIDDLDDLYRGASAKYGFAEYFEQHGNDPVSLREQWKWQKTLIETLQLVFMAECQHQNWVGALQAHRLLEDTLNQMREALDQIRIEESSDPPKK